MRSTQAVHRLHAAAYWAYEVWGGRVGSVRREVVAGIGGAAAMAALTAWMRPPRAPTAEPQPETGATSEKATVKGASGTTSSGRADYQWVVNVAAGVVTLSAGVLGVFGITGGVAVSLLRNAPAAVATASLAAGVAVLLGVASAFISPELTQRNQPRTTKRITILTAVLVVAALVTTGKDFASLAAPSLVARVLWWLFLALIGALMLWGARVIVKGASAAPPPSRDRRHDLDKVPGDLLDGQGQGYRLKTLAILTSLAVFGVSVLCVVVLASGVSRAASRPAVSVTLDFKPAAANAATGTSRGIPGATSPQGSFVLHVTVKSLGMPSDERFLVVVDRVDLPVKATQLKEVYLTYVGPDAAGNVQYTFSIPLAVDKVVPWLGVSATLQHVGQPPTDPGEDPCGVEKGGSRPSGSTCALVYADPTLTA
jgi:hypothetical protein